MSVMLSQKIIPNLFEYVEFNESEFWAINGNTKDVGETIAKSIVNFFSNKSNLKLIDKLSSFGVNMNFLTVINFEKDSIYYKKCFCITGSFDIPRNEIKKLLEQKYDATVVNSITNDVDYLIASDFTSTKYKKAIANNIKIITEKIW